MTNYLENLFTDEQLKILRDQFYYVDTDYKGRKRVFFDNAGGALRLKKCEEDFAKIDALPDCAEHANQAALELFEVENKGRADARLLFNARHGVIATGYTATQLMMYVANVISANAVGTNVVTTALEHPSAFDAMAINAEKYHRELRVAPANPVTGGIDAETVLSLVDKDTAVLSVMSASNISGHIMDIGTIAREARKINPDIYIISDAVQHAPHGALDPESCGVDAMNMAPYKFFGIRGFSLMYLSDRVKDLPHDKAICLKSDQWESGSPASAHFVAISAIVDYVASIGKWVSPDETDRRKLFELGMARLAAHEQALLYILLEGTDKVEGLRHMKGVTVKMDDPDLTKRDFITGIEFDNMPADKAREELEKYGFVTFERLASSPYSDRMLKQFDSEGVVRLSPLHINTPAEMEQFLLAAKKVASL